MCAHTKRVQPRLYRLQSGKVDCAIQARVRVGGWQRILFGALVVSSVERNRQQRFSARWIFFSATPLHRPHPRATNRVICCNLSRKSAQSGVALNFASQMVDFQESSDDFLARRSALDTLQAKEKVRTKILNLQRSALIQPRTGLRKL
jgi:hypothetical protein